MKTLLTVAALFMAGSWSFAGGGGIVDFENFSNSLVYTNSVHNGPATGLISGDHAFYFALLEAETNTVDVIHLFDGSPLSQGGWSYDALATNTPTPGMLNGNYTTDPGVGVSEPSGLPANFVVVGWSANIGSTYADAKAWWGNGHPNATLSGYFAISGIATDVVVGGSVFPVPTIFGPTPGYEVQGFTLNLYTIPPPPQITGITVNGTNVLLSFPTILNYPYYVQSTTDLVSGSWSTIANNIVGTGGIATNIDIGGAGVSKRFYRVKMPKVQAVDSAADPAYTNGWADGSNGGVGFEPWELTGTGVLGSSSNGFFIGSSTNNASGTSPGIDVSGKSWGIYANSNNFTAAWRAFPGRQLQVGQSFVMSMDNGYIDGGGSIGFVLHCCILGGPPSAYNVDARFEFLYVGFDATNSYKVVDAGGLRNIGLPFTGTGLSLVFTLNTADTYMLLAIDNITGTTNMVTGTLAGSGTIAGLTLFNRNAGSNPDHYAFFNSLQIIGP